MLCQRPRPTRHVVGLRADSPTLSPRPITLIESTLNRYRRSARVLFGTLAVYALLVATHQGEFWPFSIYPMFSQGGVAWSRAVVRQVPDDNVRWEPTTQEDLPGTPHALADHGVDHIDLGSFVVQTREWDAVRVEALRRMLGEAELRRRNLLIMRVNGRISARDSVVVSFIPYALLTSDRSIFSDALQRPSRP